jgi:predicted DsbA family dithiol-disulfide isomerase
VALLEVYADVWCPFTHVGLTWVRSRRTRLGRDDLAVHVRSWPLELVNGRPLDPSAVAEHVRELREQVSPGLFSGFDPATFPTTTLPALALAAAAYEHGLDLGWTVSLALRQALFEEGRDISDLRVLDEVARAHGLGDARTTDDEAVRREWREGRARGVKGSPHFFCGANDVFCPSLDIGRDAEGHLQLHRSVGLLDAFLSNCVGLGGAADSDPQPGRPAT